MDQIDQFINYSYLTELSKKKKSLRNNYTKNEGASDGVMVNKLDL